MTTKTIPSQRLWVPAEWLAACGMGNRDRTLPVIDTRVLRGWTFADVLVDGRKWTVNVEMRGARFE